MVILAESRTDYDISFPEFMVSSTVSNLTNIFGAITTTKVEVVPAQASYGGHEINRLVAAAMRTRRDIERWTLGFFAAKGRALAMQHLVNGQIWSQ